MEVLFLSNKANTKKGVETGKRVLNKFCESSGSTYNESRIPQHATHLYADEEITPKFFDCYAEYLFHLTYTDAKNDGKETHYASGSALQYYSDAMTILKEAYPHLAL